MVSIHSIAKCGRDCVQFLKEQALVVDIGLNSRINKVANACLRPLHTLIDPAKLRIFSVKPYGNVKEELLFDPINKKLAYILVVPATVVAVALKVFNYIISLDYRNSFRDMRAYREEEKIYCQTALEIFGGLYEIRKLVDISNGSNLKIKKEFNISDFAHFPVENFKKDDVVKGTFGKNALRPFIAIKYTKHELTPTGAIMESPHVAVLYPSPYEDCIGLVKGTEPCYDRETVVLTERAQKIFTNLMADKQSPDYDLVGNNPRLLTQGQPVYTLGHSN